MRGRNIVLGLLARILFALFGAAMVLDAQEKPARSTRQWHMLTLPTGGNRDYFPVRVDVIDAEGVCLYVARSWASSTAPAITAVPKTQLPPSTVVLL